MFIAIIMLSTIVQGLIALFVLQKNSKSLTNILFFSLSISLMAWAGINFIITNDPFSSTQLILYRMLMATVVAQNTFFFLFAHTYPNQKIDVKPKKLKLYLALSIIAEAAALSPFLFTSVEYGSEGARPVAGPGMLLFVLHAALSVSSGLYSLYKRYKSSVSNQKKQLRLILIGAILLWGIVPLTNFVFSLATQTLFFASISPVYTLVFSSLIAYAIVKHRAFDVRLVVARSVAYVFSLGILVIGYATLSSLLLNRILAAYDSDALTFVINSLAFVLAVLIYPRIKRFFDKKTNQLFYRDAYDPQGFLDQLNETLVSNASLEVILRQASLTMQENIKCDFCIVSVRVSNTWPWRAIGTNNHKVNTVDTDLIGAELSRTGEKILIADFLEINQSRLKRLLEQNNISMVVNLITNYRAQENATAYLFLGPKQSGNIYNKQDMRILDIIADELMIAIQNALRYEEIQSFNQTLQNKINDATEALKRTNKKLIALDDAKDDFIGMASHQLRTPLTSIKGYISMMLDGDLGKVSPTQRQALKEAFDSSQRMVYLISDFLNVSRIRTGKFTLETGKTDLTRIVSEEIGQLRDMAGLRGQKIIFTPPPNFPVVCLDEMKIRQVMMNMIDNAIFYTPKNGTIEITLEKTTNEIIFKVTDSGIGVPLSDQHRLFTKFFRAANAKKARPDGTGLGLFMAQKIIAAQEGKIIFKSTEGQGSTFGFRFPLNKVALKP